MAVSLFHFILIASSSLCFLINFVFSIGMFIPGFAGFPYTIEEINFNYYLSIKLPSWTYTMLFTSLVWLIIIKLYQITAMFRDNRANKSMVNRNPATNIVFLFVEILTYVLNIIGIALWARESMVAAIIFVLFVILLSWLNFGTLCLATGHFMENEEDYNYGDTLMVMAGLFNGWGMFTWWNMFNGLHTLALTINYNTEQGTSLVDEVPGALTMYIIMLLSMIIWFTLDCTVLDKYTRLCITPYIVWMFFLGAIYSENYILLEEDVIFLGNINVGCLSIAVITFIAKLVFAGYRHAKEQDDDE